jgi:hypothetical protein
MVEQIGQASGALAILDAVMSGLADVAVRSWRAGAVKKYEAGTALSSPTTAAMRIERIMIVVPSAGCRIGAPGSPTRILSSVVHCCIKEALASLISIRLESASLVI